jgi:hypothetical protein
MQTTLAQVVEKSLVPLRAISEAEASVKPAPGKWSKKEILGHLIDSAANNHQRFVRLQLESEVTLPGYEQDGWVRVNGYQNRAWTDIVSLWAAYNTHLAYVIENLDPGTLTHVWHHPEADFTLIYLAEDYVTHLQHHLKQIGA